MPTDEAGSRIVEVKLPNGATALVRAVDLDGGATKTKFGDRFDFTDVAATLEGLSDAIRASLVKAAPDTVTVELGLELAVKSGKLTGLLVERRGQRIAGGLGAQEDAGLLTVNPLGSLLRRCVIRVEGDGEFSGSGFLVAPGEVRDDPTYLTHSP